MKYPLWIGILCFLVTTASASEVVFRDDFAGGKSPKWRQFSDGARPGSFRVQNGAYVLSSADSVTSIPRAIVRSATTTNYFIQADVRLRPLAKDVASASLLSYYADSRHFYEFTLDALNSYWYLRKIDKSGSALLAQGVVFGAPRSLFRLGLYCREGDIRVFVDGVMLAQEFDNHPIAGGAFGLSAQGAEAQWDNVLVRISNPQDFFYGIQSQKTDTGGKAAFMKTHLMVTDDGSKPLSGITVYRIRRDGLSYYAVQDSRNRYAPRSGFLSEFDLMPAGEFKIRMSKVDSAPAQSHQYQTYEIDWMMDFLNRSARLAPDHVSADLQTIRGIHLQKDVFLDTASSPVGDLRIAKAGYAAEVNGMIFGNWEDFGNFRLFPSVSGRATPNDSLVSRQASAAHAPQNSLFTLYVLRLSAGSAPVSFAWFVQQDSRAFVLVDSATFPSELQRGKSYQVPFTLLNTGEAAGPFQLSVLLSRNSFAGATDIPLGRRTFSGLPAHERIQSDMNIELPADVPDGRYFIATFLEAANIRDRTMRVHNGNFIKPIVLGPASANGSLSVTLSWNGSADLDLHLTDPYGETIYYFHPASASGGALQQDHECAAQDQTEVITYPSGQAVSGAYAISIHYFRACNVPRDVSWKLIVTSDKGTQNYSGVVHPGDYIRAADYIR